MSESAKALTAGRQQRLMQVICRRGFEPLCDIESGHRKNHGCEAHR